MATNIVRVKNLNMSKLSYSPVSKLPSGGKMVYVNYDGGKGIFQTPICMVPYGIQLPMNVTEDSPASMKSYSIEISLSGMDTVEEMKTLFTKLNELQEKIIEDAVVNSTAWFGKKYTSTEVLRELFSPIIKYSKDKETGAIKTQYPPTFKVKLPWSNTTDKFTFACCDMDKQDIDLNDIRKVMKGGRVRILIQIAGIWFIGGKFGVSLKAFQGQFEPIVQGKAGAFAFEDDSDDDVEKAKKHIEKIDYDEDLAEDVAEMGAVLAKTNLSKKEEVKSVKKEEVKPVEIEIEVDEEEHVEDEEEHVEEDEEEEPVTPPPPPPVVTKKRAVAKKTAA